jgi:hypothetical protein
VEREKLVVSGRKRRVIRALKSISSEQAVKLGSVGRLDCIAAGVKNSSQALSCVGGWRLGGIASNWSELMLCTTMGGC